MTAAPRLRCAIYTRKSSEEGLDQEFNSLDAQREACAAYIASQASLGWKLIPDFYDDGGISGGTIERPALQRLLKDIRDRHVDVVVVYKIDRLTRSLMDFSRIVEIFDASSVSFVSVTQAFNTTSSMGRLTLNVLLSFAQFEREVTAERIRDKIAASRAKGMWMGGRIPFGYQVHDRKLIVDPVEASHIRQIFQRYLALGSVRKLADEVNREKIGRSTGPDFTPWTRGKLYYLLTNQIYVGKVRHHKRHFDGDHEAVIDADQFERVQVRLSQQAPNRDKPSANGTEPHLLTGLLFDETGDRLSPTHARNHGRRYRYYASARLKTARSSDGWRVPASELEAIVDQQVRQLLADETRLASWIDTNSDSAALQNVLQAAKKRSVTYCEDDTRALLQRAVRRIILHPNRIEMLIATERLVELLLGDAKPDVSLCQNAKLNDASRDSSLIATSAPITIRRRGVETRLTIDGDATFSRKPEPTLVDAIARAHLYLGKLTDGANRSVAEVGDLYGVHSADVSRMIPLAFLAPKIVAKILTGNQPGNLTIRRLARIGELPLKWQVQEAEFLG